MINTGGESELRGDREAEPAVLDDGPLTLHHLHLVAGFLGGIGVFFAVGPRLPEGCPDVTGGADVHSNAVLSFVDGLGDRMTGSSRMRTLAVWSKVARHGARRKRAQHTERERQRGREGGREGGRGGGGRECVDMCGVEEEAEKVDRHPIRTLEHMQSADRATVGVDTGQTFREGGDCAFSGGVGWCCALAEDAGERRHVDDVAADLTQVRQGKLARSKVTDKVQLEEVLHVLNGELVDRLWRRVPSSLRRAAMTSSSKRTSAWQPEE